jgi:hypothetical protein
MHPLHLINNSMAQIEVLYTQALARIDPEVSKPRLLLGFNNKNMKKGLSPPPLREQINIRHTGVVNKAPINFWLEHPEIIVTFIVGDLHRDRIDDKSCVLYFILCLCR